MIEMILQNSVVVILFTLGILVLIHELGHYLVGVFFKMGVVSFSIGFGPKLLSWYHRSTEFRLGLIPLGGYVQFAGATPHEQVPAAFVGKELYQRPVWQRSLMVLAGPIANLLLAGGVFAVIAFKGVPEPPAIIGVVEPGSRAAAAGIEVGDTILQMGERTINSWSDLVAAAQAYATEPITVDVSRGDEIYVLNLDGGEADGKLGVISGFLTSLVYVAPDSYMSQFGLPPAVRLHGIELSLSPLPATPHPISRWHEIMQYLARHLTTDLSVPQYLHLQYEAPSSTFLADLSSSAQEPSPSGTPQLTLATVSVALTPSQLQQAQQIQPSAPRAQALSQQIGMLSGELMVVGSALRLSQFVSADTVQEYMAKGQLQVGDYIQAVQGESVAHLYDWYEQMNAYNELKSIEVTVIRNGEPHSQLIEQIPRRYQTPEGPAIHYMFPYQVGEPLIAPPMVIRRASGVLASLSTGFQEAVGYSYEIMQSLIGMVVGAVPVKSLGGPILIAQVARESAAQGLITYLTMLALISLNLFLINLIPIPVLDGGQLVLLGIEGCRGRRLSRAFVEKYQAIGFVLILSLIILATYNDVSRYWLSMLEGLGLG